MVTNRWVAENWSLTSLFRTDDSTDMTVPIIYILGFIATSLNASSSSSSLHSLVFNYVRCKTNSLRFPFVSRKQVDVTKPVITKKN